MSGASATVAGSASEEEDKFVQVKDGVVSKVLRGAGEVRLLREALLHGDVPTHRPPLPEAIVTQILDNAEYWCVAEKIHEDTFEGGSLNYRVFKFSALPGIPRKVKFRITSHDQGWSSYPEDQGTQRNSWTWGEVDIIDPVTGMSKLQERPRVFTNVHASSTWKTHSVDYAGFDGFMAQYAPGDVLEFYCRSMFPGWCIYVRDAKMEVHYAPIEKERPVE